MSSPRAALLHGVGVMGHVPYPTVDDCVAIATAAETAGADWCVLPDAFVWRDVWMTLTAAAEATNRIRLGPGLTNPYTRHPWVTLGALATLDEISAGRALLGIAAGGSELPRHGAIDRSNAPSRVRDLIADLRAASRGEPPLPMASSMGDVPVLGAARSPKMLETVAESCDVVLAFGQPHAQIQATADRVASSQADLAWAPILGSYGNHPAGAITYALLNAPEAIRRDLGLTAEGERKLRRVLLEDGFQAASEHVPASATDGFVTDDDVEAAADTARKLGARSITVLAIDTGPVYERVQWARDVLARAGV